MAFTEFYMQSGGSNLNAGSTNSNTAVYTSTNGSWSTVTNLFTPTDGSTPANSINVGDWASIYLDAATVGVCIGRVTNVAAGVNGAITISTTFRAGTAPTTGATGRSIKVGGAWAGINGTETFPFSLSNLNNLTNTNGNSPRFNFKNDQTYTVTANVSMALQGVIVQGYSSSVGDGGKASFSTNLTSNTGFTISGTGGSVIDIDFANTGASNSNTLVSSSGACNNFVRCVFHGSRGRGLQIGSTGGSAIECEAYDNNKSNTANLGGIVANATSNVITSCYSHDNTGSNASGFVFSASTAQATFLNCVSESNGGSGLLITASTGSGIQVINCDFYNNTGDGIKNISTASPLSLELFQNCNFLKNGGKAINMAVTGAVPGDVHGFSYNNGYGSGTEANGASDTLSNLTEVGKVTYPSNVTPWKAPTTGDFTLVSTNTHAGYNAGRSHFEENDGTNTGTVGYPDIGAAQALVSSKSSQVFCG